MSGKYFKSTGTIRVFSSARKMMIFFTPNAEHSVSRCGKHYALFAPSKKRKGCATVSKFDSDKGVKIRVGGKFPGLAGLVAAATQRTVVEVEVQNSSSWTLHAITIPAPGKEK